MYEHQTYVEARRRFPREGKTLKTGRGPEKVVSVDIWQERVVLKDREGERRTLTLDELRKDVGRGGRSRSSPEEDSKNSEEKRQGKRGPE
jgi:cell fate regulator YaaT (PSP1 superfamily)